MPDSVTLLPEDLKTEKSVPVVFACDDNYAEYLCVTIQSLIENASDDHVYHIIVLDCGIETESAALLTRRIARQPNFTLHLIAMADFLQKYKTAFKKKGRFTPAIYGRLLIPEICRHFDKVIYADIDMIFNRDIASLLKIDLTDNYIAAAVDIKIEFTGRSHKRTAKYYHETLSLTEKDHYINSGLLVFNIRNWLELSLHEKCIHLLQEKTRLQSPDQDAINIICKGHITYLDQVWNCRYVPGEYFQAYKNRMENDIFLDRTAQSHMAAATGQKTVFHYVSPIKPWNRPNLEKAEYWWQYAKNIEIYEKLLFEASSFTPYKKSYHIFGLRFAKVETGKNSQRYFFLGLPVARKVQETKRKIYYLFGIQALTVRY